MPHAGGIADRLRRLPGQAPARARAPICWRRALDYGVGQLGFDADRFVHELVDSIIGDTYPVPDRMLVHNEQIVRRFLDKVMCDDRPPPGKFDLFAVEGGTAAMCYVFKSLMANRLLRRGDTVALGTPIFTPVPRAAAPGGLRLADRRGGADHDERGHPHLAIPRRGDRQAGRPEGEGLLPGQPVQPGVVRAWPRRRRRASSSWCARKRPDLLILTDDVYGTFVEGFRSLAADLPANTILVYSYSKHFGCTGWRLGVVALHEDNVLDRKIAELPEADRAALHRRYESADHRARDAEVHRSPGRRQPRRGPQPHRRAVAARSRCRWRCSRCSPCWTTDDAYQNRCRAIVGERLDRLARGLGIAVPHDPRRVGYYVDLDLAVWGRKAFGEEFVKYVAEHTAPIEVVLGLARGTARCC